MKKVLFIDRDGTIIIEPEDEQIDSLDKLEFYPKAIVNLFKIAKEMDYELVMVTNQDGLGTDSFPEDTFWPAHNKMMNLLKNERIKFSEVLIDRSFPKDNSPDRKPGTGMLGKYIHGNYNMEQSFVIGDRESDIQLGKNLGCKSIYLSEKQNDNAVLITKDWDDIYNFLKGEKRIAEVKRSTKETDISVKINLDGSGKGKINTGIDFFDHMLEQVARHSGCDLEIKVKGDLEVDEHHTIEDTALALGEAFRNALGSKKGIERYGFLLPMDDSLVQIAVDFSGRSWLVWKAKFKREKIGEVPTEMFYHFFKSFCDTAGCNLNVKAIGDNEHHKIEAIFKAFGKSIKQAVSKTGTSEIPSTKGTL